MMFHIWLWYTPCQTALGTLLGLLELNSPLRETTLDINERTWVSEPC